MHIYLFSGTHWDREWYQTFQGFRFRLVNMLDHLVDYFEKYDSESVFHLELVRQSFLMTMRKSILRV